MLDRPNNPSRPRDVPPRDVVSPASDKAPDPETAEARREAPESDRTSLDKPKREDAQPDREDEQADDAAAEGDEKEHGSVKGASSFTRKHPIGVTIGIIVLIAAAIAGTLYYLHARHFESTDDAFIDGRPVSISPEVNGNIVAVPVNDNQIVKAGDVLVRIDQRDYQAALDNAQAQIEQAEATVANYNAQISAQQSQIDGARRQVSEAQAALSFALDENKRYQDLAKTGYGTVQRAQQSASDLQQRQAALDAAEASEAGAEKQINVLRAQVRTAGGQRDQAVAQKAQADANLSRTTLRATVDGRVTRLTGAVGQVATSQSALMVLVPLDVWVTANFKETQLASMKPGQSVSIEIDSLGKSFPGHVDSVQAGSGTAFSLLPAENATGNYVKVVQRIPVKITFDQRPTWNSVRACLSCRP